MYVAVGAIVVVVAVTRTEVGREGLRNEMVRQFNRSMRGSLEIGQMTGNVFNRLSAEDVVVRDSSGRAVLSIDRVVLHPSWTDILRRTVSTGRVTLVRPALELHQDEDGAWNLSSAFGALSSTSPGEPWTFRSTRLEIVDGHIRTRSAAAAPRLVRSGSLFDWTNAEMAGLNGRVLVDWEPDVKLVDVLEMSGRLATTSLHVDSLRGQFVLDRGRLALNEIHLKTRASSLHLNGSVSTLEALRTDFRSAELELDVAPSTLEGDELTRIFPRLAIEGPVAADLRVQGPLHNLVVAQLSVARGGSDILAEGRLRGLPDSLGYEAAIRSASIQWGDLQAVWPDAPVPSFDHLGAVDVSGSVRGLVPLDDRPGFTGWEGTHDLVVETGAGRAEGSARVSVGGESSTSVDARIALTSFDAGRLVDRSDVTSNVNGTLIVSASGPSIRDLEGEASVALTRSTWAARTLDTLRLDVRGSPGALAGDLMASDAAGSLTARLSADLASSVPSYQIEGRTTGLDVGRLMLSDSLVSSLNATFRVDGRGRSWTAFEGDVSYEFDASRVAYGSREHAVPAHASQLTVRQADAASPRLVLRGDVLDLEMTGDVSLRPLTLLARHWAAEVARSVVEERSKPYRRAAVDSSLAELLSAASASIVAPPPSTPLDAGEQEVQIRLHVRRSDILSALFPTFPPIRTDLRADALIRMDPERFDVTVRAEADSMDVGDVRSRDVSVELTASAAGPSVSRSLSADVTGTVSTLSTGAQEIIDPAISVVYDNRGFDLAADAVASGAAAPWRLRARMDLLNDRNRLVIHDFQAGVSEQVWTAPGVNIVDFFQEAIYIRGIRIERASADGSGRTTAGGGGPTMADGSGRTTAGGDETATDGGVESPATNAGSEYLELFGTLSSAPDDTLFVRAEDLRMRHVGTMIGIGSDLDGRLDGRLAFTGLNRRPELTGRIDIEPLTYRNRHLGRLSVTSRYIPGSPDVALRAELSPAAVQDPALLVEENALTVEGAFRLPGFGDAAEPNDAGTLDLDVSVERADAFFFDYLFRDLVADVSGHIEGTGHVGGDFDAPLFDADLAVRDGRFRIPEFGLAYGVAGPVTVDRQGIHLDALGVTDTNGGEARVDGSILFNEYRFFSFDLHGALDDVLIMNVPQSRELPFYGRIVASGDVALTGPLSSALLQSSNARTNPESDLYIPIAETGAATDAGFIVFADSSGAIPDFGGLTRRRSLLARRPAGERPFLDGLEMDLNILAPQGSTVHLVIDPLLGDVINAVGSGRIQLVRDEGEFSTYGTFTVSSGDYLFTAGEVFVRRFLIDSGTITWDGDPLNAMLDISASYRTRASTEGLGLSGQEQRLIPLVIELDVTGRVATPNVGLALSIDRADRNLIGGYEGLEALLNQPEQAAQYATSVLLTNSFLLTADQPLAQSRGQLAFNSLSQLVASQLNRYINYALPNVNLNLGVQGESAQDLDVTYGVALRMLDERLIIRGQGIYPTDELRRQEQAILDEFVVEVRLNPRVSVEVFYRREDDLLSTESLNTSTTGAGLSYQTEFSTWRRLVRRLFGRTPPDVLEPEEDGEEAGDDVVAGADE